ncbi:COG3014 family protein [Chitinophaga defluvii]|uniref:SusD-like starch-binding protein associating with outer membrane n=1 Tax=Chitinophaga defluvii TaxID=3163343 RepID=A0ABV2TDS8_9BACT
MNQYLNKKWALLITAVMSIFVSCQTYNSKISSYYTHLAQGSYEAADRDLDHNKYLQRKRNKLLFLLEKGRTAFLMGDYTASNQYLNAADSLLESGYHRVWDQAVGLLTNPAMQQYRGEDFEKLLIHYYKAINYLHLRLPEDAVVEARRITLSNNALNDQRNNNANKYSNDAFSLILQGIIYESAHHINDAFISYRNAADLYLKNKDNSYYGVKLPEQLQQDLLRTAYLNGFQSELAYYEQQFNRTYVPAPAAPGGELLLFWENGLAPVKAENNIFFTLTQNGPGSFGFTDEQHTVFIPFDFNLFPRDSAHRLKGLQTFRVAFPKYVEQPLYFTQAQVMPDSAHAITLEMVEDVNKLAFKTLQERFLKEMGLALTRLAIKKLAEHEIKKKDETAGQVFDALSFLTEKADTRNWQSLPYAIYYARIPLNQGNNDISVQLRNIQGTTSKVTLQVEGKGILQTRHITSLQRS